MHDAYLIGRHVTEVPTPALILDRVALEVNIRALQDMVGGAGLANRPHAKGHKSVAIAKRQLAAGAVGVCCQKLAEAEVFVAAGIDGILLSNEVIDSRKLVRACELAKRSRLILVADSAIGVERLASAAAHAGLRMEVLVELDIGQHRCGVSSPEEAVALAAKIERSGRLVLKGLQAYQGKLQHVAGWWARRAAVLQAMERLEATLATFRAKGLCTDIVSGGGTGTVEFDCEIGLLNEVQPGSYAIMDTQYKSIGGRTADRFELFRAAIFVITQVISRRGNAWCVVDAGLKALASDAGHPQVIGADAYAFAGDEHGIIDLGGRSGGPTIGDRLWIIPGHCDTTVNLHDRYVVVEYERVVDIWPVNARGALA